MNRLTIVFQPCTPAPSNGYEMYYRKVGSTEAYKFAGTYNSSPAKFDIREDPDGTAYEGFLQSNCGNKTGHNIPFTTLVSDATGHIFSYSDVLNSPCSNQLGTVVLYFSGVLGTGTVLYTDPQMQHPFTAHIVVLDPDSGLVFYSVNQTTGEILQIGAC